MYNVCLWKQILQFDRDPSAVENPGHPALLIAGRIPPQLACFVPFSTLQALDPGQLRVSGAKEHLALGPGLDDDHIGAPTTHLTDSF